MTGEQKRLGVLMAFQVGDRVEKVGGRYGGPGRVVGVIDAEPDGYVLYVVAHRIAGGFGEFKHVYPAANLRLLNLERTDP